MSRAISWESLSAKWLYTSRLVRSVAGCPRNSQRAAPCLLKHGYCRNSVRKFYAGIRSSVLADIGRDRTLSKPSLFRPRWLYATAFAAVVIASGLMLQHFSRTRRTASQNLTLAPQVTGQPKSDQAKRTSGSSSPQSPGRSGGKFGPVRRPDASDSAQAGRKNNEQIAQATQAPTSVAPVGFDSTTLSDGSVSSSSGLAPSSQVSRIEIQTANPNIRIIWLAPQESEGTEETNRDQDQHENGNRK